MPTPLDPPHPALDRMALVNHPSARDLLRDFVETPAYHVFDSQMNPNTHDAKPFACAQCPKSFSHNPSLRRHERIHGVSSDRTYYRPSSSETPSVHPPNRHNTSNAAHRPPAPSSRRKPAKHQECTACRNRKHCSVHATKIIMDRLKTGAACASCNTRKKKCQGVPCARCLKAGERCEPQPTNLLARKSQVGDEQARTPSHHNRGGEFRVPQLPLRKAPIPEITVMPLPILPQRERAVVPPDVSAISTYCSSESSSTLFTIDELTDDTGTSESEYISTPFTMEEIANYFWTSKSDGAATPFMEQTADDSWFTQSECSSSQFTLEEPADYLWASESECPPNRFMEQAAEDTWASQSECSSSRFTFEEMADDIWTSDSESSSITFNIRETTDDGWIPEGGNRYKYASSLPFNHDDREKSTGIPTPLPGQPVVNSHEGDIQNLISHPSSLYLSYCALGDPTHVCGAKCMEAALHAWQKKMEDDAKEKDEGFTLGADDGVAIRNLNELSGVQLTPSVLSNTPSPPDANLAFIVSPDRSERNVTYPCENVQRTSAPPLDVVPVAKFPHHPLRQPSRLESYFCKKGALYGSLRKRCFRCQFTGLPSNYSNSKPRSKILKNRIKRTNFEFKAIRESHHVVAIGDENTVSSPSRSESLVTCADDAGQRNFVSPCQSRMRPLIRPTSAWASTTLSQDSADRPRAGHWRRFDIRSAVTTILDAIRGGMIHIAREGSEHVREYNPLAVREFDWLRRGLRKQYAICDDSDTIGVVSRLTKTFYGVWGGLNNVGILYKLDKFLKVVERAFFSALCGECSKTIETFRTENYDINTEILHDIMIWRVLGALSFGHYINREKICSTGFTLNRQQQ
ncbi:hypothetical protein BC938DRAFT_484282 [Jimgerdemannia flammicorona]|uniref:C2H2-type domain-containing protein n=1 Tax=Jimgerdemannia flammicorona TaxID=994334 RepID=A0A433QV82_9FUNG|nr:hypothetical protein BC938DRAFT_484282 [Jimgerdemannia flammicorona]